MKNKIIIICICVVACLAVLIIAKTNIKNNGILKVDTSSEIKENIKYEDIYANDKNIVLKLIGTADYAINIEDKDVRRKDSEFIVIGIVQKIDGSTNYNPTEKLYTQIMTLGDIKVDKVIKGIIDNKTIPFIRLGGVISFEEYEKGLQESQRIKMDLVHSLTLDEKKTKYVSYYSDDDIKFEVGKTYVMYLNYNKDYDRYTIRFSGHGLFEVDVNTLNNDTKQVTKEEKNKIKVKNNKSGEFESLIEAIGEV